MADLQKYKPLLHDNPLCGINTYKDTLNLAAGACTRQIYKLVLTGDETWAMGSGATPYPYILKANLPYPHASDSALLCTHFVNGNNGMTNGTSYALLTGGYAATGATDLTTWKAWLAQQYANGTPVIVWYVLAESITETITVPTGLSGTEEGYLMQSGTPTPTNPIYPTANEALIWQHSLRKLTTATDTLTTLPVNIYADGNNATVGLKGNTVQNGTPTPSNPVEVNGVGERTENIFNPNSVDTAKGYMENYRLNSGNPEVAVRNFITEYIAVIPDSTYTISGFATGWTSSVVWYDNSLVKIGYQLYENKSVNTFTIPSNAKYVRFTGDMAKKDITMFNTGSTAKPFEPWGYKIPISSASTTTPVYLGEVQSTRRIKKLVLTGNEPFYKNDTSNPLNYLYYQTSYLANKYCFCTHLDNMGTLSTSKVGVFNDNNVLYLNFGSAIMDTQPSGNTVAGLKEYLAAQYAAGTPVTVWYVLAEPETAVVNEPLMKIGDYADTVSDVTIPTITGKDTFDVETALKPSEVSLSYTGWHDATVKEWDGSQWNE